MQKILTELKKNIYMDNHYKTIYKPEASTSSYRVHFLKVSVEVYFSVLFFSHNFTDLDSKHGINASNYCRNPNGESTVWSYTIDPNVIWEFCNVRECCEYHILLPSAKFGAR